MHGKQDHKRYLKISHINKKVVEDIIRLLKKKLEEKVCSLPQEAKY